MSARYDTDAMIGQRMMVDALNSMIGKTKELQDIKAQDTRNAKTSEGKEAGAQRAAMEKEAAQSAARVAEAQIGATKAAQNALLDETRAGIAARTAVEMSFANREAEIKRAELQAELAALDKGSKDYLTARKALQDKETELEAQHAAQLEEISSRGTVEAYQKNLRDLEQSQREQIEATREGSAERLAAINAALKEEESQGLQDTTFYRDLLNQKVQTTRTMLAEQAKLEEEAGKEQADNQEKMGGLLVASMKETFALYDSAHRTSDATRVAQAIAVSNQEYQIKAAALQHEVEALDKSGKDYQNKLKALQDKEKQQVQQHENEVTAIKDKAEMERNQRILAADQRFNDSIAQGLTNVLMRHQTFTQMMTSLSNQVVSGMMENAIKSILADDMAKERDAAAAARKAYLAGMQLPFPANIVAAPALAAGAFASVMAFQEGTDSVPGAMGGDRVPALLERGEGVVPGGVMEGLRNVAQNGGFNQKPSTTVHLHNTFHVSTIDGDGMAEALEKHGEQLEHHMQRAVRRMNG